ncbi:hypothetical protein JCM11641_004501 [Rhodosporidiobolus odoratus]
MLTKDCKLLSFTLPDDSAPPAFPGLISSLRPIKRIIPQLSDEAALLRRFTYKNKNQFKGTGWWKKLVEVDRLTAKALDEFKGWLGEFGLQAENDEPTIITREAVCRGLLRLPRSIVMAEKTLSVLLGCASILEQLVHSRAFLAFALVVFALVARLHSLVTTLGDELGRTSGVLVKLAELNKLFVSLEKPIRLLPRELRQLLPLQLPEQSFSIPASAVSSLPPSNAPSPRIASPVPSSTAEEIGAIVSRSTLSAAALGKAAPSPAVVGVKPKKKRPLPSPAASTPFSSAHPSRHPSPSSLLPLDLDHVPTPGPSHSRLAPSAPSESSKPAKRPRVEDASQKKSEKMVKASGKSEVGKVGKEEGKVKKKAKKRKVGGDEIDDIFG